MDLEVLKALGDETRYALYRELAGSTAPLSARDLADALDLHANTVRLHLERLQDAGLVDVEVIHRGTVGRPQHRYSLAPGAPGPRLRPAGARAARRAPRRAGRADGRRRRGGARDRPGLGRRGGRSAPRAGRAWTRSPRSSTGSASSPRPTRTSAPDGTARIDFLHCPFRELAEAYPELVCNLHRGLCEGVAEGRPGNRGAVLDVVRAGSVPRRGRGTLNVRISPRRPADDHDQSHPHRRPAQFTLTDAAAAKVKSLIEAEDTPDLALRVAVRPGGCSGFSYEMFFDADVADDDMKSEQGGVTVVIDPASIEHLGGGVARLPRRPPGRRVPHQEPERRAHLRLRPVVLLDLTVLGTLKPSEA